MKLTVKQLKRLIKEEVIKASYTIRENREPLSQEDYRKLKALVKQYADALQDPRAVPSAEEVLQQIADLAGGDTAEFYSNAFTKHI